MKKYFVCIFLLCGILFSSTQVYGLTSMQQQLTNIYNEFTRKVGTSYTLEKQIEVYQTISQKINTLISSNRLSASKKNALLYLYDLNNEKISTLQSSQTLSTKSPLLLQREKEVKYLVGLIGTTQEVSMPNYISAILQNADTDFQLTNEKYEFKDSTKVKKYFFKNYYTLDSSNYRAFYGKTGVILKDTGSTSYIFVEDYYVEEKIPYSQLFGTNYASQFISDQKKYILDQGVYYTFDFENYNVFDDVYGMYETNLKSLGFSLQSAVFYLDEIGNFGFVKDPSRIKLIGADILDGVTNTSEFLRNLIDDKKYLYSDTDVDFKKLKQETEKLVFGISSDSQKISKIYEWIVKNIDYTRQVDLSDKKIFSGILTYRNKDGVCDGYTKLMGYMLLFAGISDIEVIKGYVIDVPDFPKIGHAWVKIGQKYYDPTFDDPVGLDTPLNFSQYRYFGLPKDLFYTNRYDYEDIPEYLISMSMSDRKKIVAKNLASLVSKYEENNYTLLSPYIFRADHNLSYDESISIQMLQNILPYYSVSSDFTFYMGGEKKYITFLQYYTIKDASEIETILSQHSYDIDGLYLFLWETGPGTNEYRIGYDVKYK